MRARLGVLLLAIPLVLVSDRERAEACGGAGAPASYCTLCHEMTAPAEELAQSPHHGKATCTDCHRLEGAGDVLEALGRLWRHFIERDLADRDAFEAERPEMARSVRRRLEATRFQVCRDCHRPGDYGEEMREVLEEVGDERDLDCTRCHEGVAHAKP